MPSEFRMMSIAETADMDANRKTAEEVPSGLSEVWLGSLVEEVERMCQAGQP